MNLPSITMTPADWFNLLAHYALLSLISIGGGLATAPDMHRYLVEERHWLSDLQFNASIALAQAAPGPNILFVALIGWNIGLNAGGYALGLLGMLLTMAGILIPSSTLTFVTARWSYRNQHLPGVRAFKQGMSPLVVGLLVATGWVIASANGNLIANWRAWIITIVTTLIVWRTRLHLLWLLGAGAVAGAAGLV